MDFVRILFQMHVSQTISAVPPFTHTINGIETTDLNMDKMNSLTNDTVKAFSEETIDLYFPLDVIIGPGEYWGHVKVYDQGIIDEERTVFEVLPKTLWEKSAVYVYFGIGGLVFLILLVLVLLKFRRR